MFLEYPKSVTIGHDDEGHPIIKIVQNAEEEKALLPPAPAKVTEKPRIRVVRGKA